MRLSPLFFLFLYLLECKGTPPEKVAPKTRLRTPSFTNQEDQLIIDELSRIPDGQLRMFSRTLWDHVADKHSQKRIQKDEGFTHERSWRSLNSHFRSMVKNNNRQHSIKVPQDLLRRFPTDQKRSPREHKFTEAEENIIIEEWLKPSCINPYGASTFQAIHAKYDAERLAKTPGFENKRTVKSIRSHMYRMKRNGHLPDEALHKFWYQVEGASSSCPPPLDQETAMEEEEMTEDDEDV